MKPVLINANNAELKYASGWKLTLSKEEPLSFMLLLEAVADGKGNQKITKIFNDRENNKMVISLRCIREEATAIRDYINDNLPQS